MLQHTLTFCPNYACTELLRRSCSLTFSPPSPPSLSLPLSFLPPHSLSLSLLLNSTNVKSVFFSALVYALAQSLIFYIYSAGYRFGAFLVIERRANFDEVFRWATLI